MTNPEKWIPTRWQNTYDSHGLINSGMIRQLIEELGEAEEKLAHYPAVWWEDSSLETWFPLTAEELKRTKEERDNLREVAAKYKEQRDVSEEQCNVYRQDCIKAERTSDKVQIELANLKENADFLRKSVGACHSAISRNNLSELQKEQWETTDLPPRFKNFVENTVLIETGKAHWEGYKSALGTKLIFGSTAEEAYNAAIDDVVNILTDSFSLLPVVSRIQELKK